MKLSQDSHFIRPFRQGMITGMLCNNAQTGDLHFEKDCSYTLIGIPHGTGGINSSGSFVFEFNWGTSKFVQIKLTPGTVLYYSGYGIMHRQKSLIDNCEGKYDHEFWNLATYTNKSFYSNFMTTMARSCNL